jgi:F-type H+-transporting ATPase subunit b
MASEATQHSAGPVESVGTVGVPAEHETDHAPNPLAPDALMVVWTWVTFGVVATLLYKIAWKPILAALDAREGRIRQSLDDAEQTRRELAAVEQTTRTMMEQAEHDGQEIIARAREQAAEAANQIEVKAHDKAKALYENADRDIAQLRRETVNAVRREQADMVIDLAGKLIARNMDSDTNRQLTEKLLGEL